MVVTIHQPEHLPWLGLFDKVLRVDLFVVLDTVQFRKNYFQNRNRIRTDAGWTWITLPVKQPVIAQINQISIDLESPVRRRYINLLRQHYLKAPYFEAYFPTLRELILSSEQNLSQANIALLRFVFGELEIQTPIILASELGVALEKGGTNVNLSICKRLGATKYLSGISGRDYLDLVPFHENGIDVEFQDFQHPVYRQLHEPFLPCMSVIDLLFNHGSASRSILREVRGHSKSALLV
jgi:hypothetical protein